MDLGGFRCYVRGRVNDRLARLLNRRPVSPSAPLEPRDLLGVSRPAALDYVRLLEGLPNSQRQATLGWWLASRGFHVERRPYSTFEGSGENFTVDVGNGSRALILIGHHDAVPGSPGANDDASAVAILLTVLERLSSDPPRSLRVRALFTGGEELGYLGARCYVRTAPLDDVVAVMSLELCGIGDNLVIWDAVPPFDAGPFLTRLCGVMEELGYRRDGSYHVVGRIPVFGSDHRAFLSRGVPAFGLTVVPGREAESLRRFVFSPLRSAFRQIVRRPPPFHTYHSAGDSLETLEAGAMERVSDALCALVAELDSRG
jgi:hypothetical protein